MEATFRHRINNAIVGSLIGFGIHSFLAFVNLSAVGFYIGDLYPFLKVAIPLAALLGLVFFILSGIKKGIIRVVSFIISIPLIPWIYYLFWI